MLFTLQYLAALQCTLIIADQYDFLGQLTRPYQSGDEEYSLHQQISQLIKLQWVHNYIKCVVAGNTAEQHNFSTLFPLFT